MRVYKVIRCRERNVRDIRDKRKREREREKIENKKR